MSNRAPAWFETKYADGVTHKIQAMGNLLMAATRPPDRLVGNIANWRVAGSAEAVQRSAAADEVSVMNLDRSLVTATMQDWEANDYIDIYDIAKMSANEQEVTQQSGAMAIGRRRDRIVISAMDAGAVTTQGNGAAAITPIDLMTAQGLIADIGVGNYEYFAAIPQIFLQQLELYREFSSSDFIGPEYPLLHQIQARRWRGITIIPVPSSFLNIPAGSQLDGFLWCRQAMGFATGFELRSRIDYIPTKKKWLAANDISACAVVILPEAVIRLRFASNIALTRPSP